MTSEQPASGMSWIDLHKTLSELEERNQERHPDAPDICWCGWEKQPGENHGMCYPGM
jgi:hypothetical protein